MRLRLPPRLQAVAELTPPCTVLADIGTDHGYLPAGLLLEGRCRRAVCSDLRRGPLSRAVQTAAAWGLEDKIDFRLGDGLQVLAPGEADCAVIAGMGGDEIATILKAAPWAADDLALVLQPMSRAETLRRFLPENGYAVRAERLTEDHGRLYPILLVSGGDMAPATDEQAWGGFMLKDDRLWGRYLGQRAARLERAAAGMEQSRNPALKTKREAYLQVAAALKQRKGVWEDAHST